MENFYEFASAALPWVATGLVLAIFFASKAANKNKKSEDKNIDNYGLLGMCLGLSIGCALGNGAGHLGIGMTTGMLLGFAVGSLIKKKDE